MQSEISAAKSNGLFASIDEFGNAMDGFTMDPMGNTVIVEPLESDDLPPRHTFTPAKIR